MVLIVTDKYDISTSRVIEYLIHFNVNFIRLNKQDEFELLDGIISDSKVDFKFRVNDSTFKYSELSFYWYRRGGLKPFLNTNNPLINFIKVDRGEEEKMYEDFFNQLFVSTLPSLGNISNNKLNKLHVLQRAKYHGINIPETFVTTFPNRFSNKRVISKGTFFTTRISYNEEGYTGGTIEIKKSQKDKLNKIIPLTSVQERIEKRFEIRSFYLKGSFYNMAIMSQSNPKTVEDFRNYDRKNPNRTFPCNLPLVIEEKLHILYLELGIDSCSTDLIKTINNKHVLLDINPIGQYGMLSGPCNYHLDRVIANHIKSEYEKAN